jgi:tRNA pseudouridine32 synthase/23S rRNA pseudouridine746 synthase
MIPVIHADDHLVVVNKPSGLLSVPGRGPDKQDCVWHRVQAQFADALVVHRLDQATSGLLVLARGIEAQRQLSRAFAHRQVDKRYLAWVQGHPPAQAHAETRRPTLAPPDPQPPIPSSTPPKGHTVSPAPPGWSAIDLPLMADWPNRPRQIVSPEGRPCLTFWRQLEQRSNPDHALLELQPHTGRSHQLRVHLQAIGHPILGDDLYGAPDAPACAALQLHAWRITLPHPFDERPLALEAPLPPHWGQIWGRIGSPPTAAPV